MESTTSKASVLIEALPYLQAFRGQTFLIKMGGSAMDDPETVERVMQDIVFLEVAGINPIVVHGGGKAISAAMKTAGFHAKFIGGFRVTTPEAISIVEDTLSGIINPRLVDMICQFGAKSAGFSGTQVFLGERIQGKSADGSSHDIGRVGQVVNCKTDILEATVKAEIIPVISPLAAEVGTKKPLNVNADLAAAALAKSLKAAKLIYLSDVPGLMQDPDDESTLIPTVDGKYEQQLIANGKISGGMIPKVQSARDALNDGVGKVHFIDGRKSHSLLLEIFTASGIGTEIVS